MDCYFSIVLYKTPSKDIKNLINSINRLEKVIKKNKSLDINLKIIVCDNFKESDYKLYKNNKLTSLHYYKNSRNMGYGSGHNKNFSLIQTKKEFLFLITNPDIQFQPSKIFPLLEYAIKNKNKYSCIAPLIYLEDGSIQYSAKKNPTIIDLIISRFSIFRRIKLLKTRYEYYINFEKDYRKDYILSTYLSGCFLLIPSKIYRKIGGFTDKYFLHLEDADITRKCAKFGKTLHIPKSSVIHKRGRGSHKSIKQQFNLIKSIFIYFKIWGIVLF